MANEYVVGKVEDFPIGSHKVVQIGNREIGVFNKDGELFALPNLCPHQVGPLCDGRVSGTLVASKQTNYKPQWTHEGEIVTCPWHGLEFHIETGQCLAYSSIKLKTYTVTVDLGQVKVSV
jgi:nitrite reductase (NADH) small subunit